MEKVSPNGVERQAISPCGVERQEIALCFSGHLRNYDQVKENLLKNLITPLQESGWDVSLFGSTWEQSEFRGGDGSLVIADQYPEFKSLVVEPEARQYFISTYSTDKWKEYSHLSGPQTCPDSVSMWYKVWSSFQLVKQADVVMRLRFDMIFDTPFDLSELEDLDDDTIFIPRWHGKYYEIGRGMMDQFAFGTYKAMKQYSSVFPCIKEVFQSGVPHTGEGFMVHQLKSMKVKRSNVSFSLQRKESMEKFV